MPGGKSHVVVSKKMAPPKEWHYDKVWPYWRKPATVEVGFEVLDMRKPHSVS